MNIERISRIRHEIQQGTYLTDDKLNLAIERLQFELDNCDDFDVCLFKIEQPRWLAYKLQPDHEDAG